MQLASRNPFSGQIVFFQNLLAHPLQHTLCMKPLNKDHFQLDTNSENFVFCHCVQETGMQAKYVKAKCFGDSQGDQESDVSNYWQPPYNPTSIFQGSRVIVHGATRYTSASLLLSNKHSDEKGPSEHVILEIQQRSDARVLWKHYLPR